MKPIMACSEYRVVRLMHQHGIVSKHKSKFRVTANSAHSFPIAENLLQRRFNVFLPGQNILARFQTAAFSSTDGD
jgi:hypothetical protein